MRTVTHFRKMALSGINEFADSQIQWMLDEHPQWDLEYTVHAWAQPYLQNCQDRSYIAEDILDSQVGSDWGCEQSIQKFNSNQELCMILKSHIDELFLEMKHGSNEIYATILAARAHENDESLKV